MSLQFDISRWTTEKFEELTMDGKTIDFDAATDKVDYKDIKNFRNGTNLIVYFFKALGELSEGVFHALSVHDILRVITTMNSDENWKCPEEKKIWEDRLISCIDSTDFNTHVLTWIYWD